MDLPHITVVRRGRTAHVEIDGKPFPYPIARGSVHVVVDPGDAPTVTLTLMAESVDVTNTLEPAAEPS